MATEIERKFLVKGDWRGFNDSCYEIKQGYLNNDLDKNVRVRIQYNVNDSRDHRSWITVKGRTNGATRTEYEFEIYDIDEAESMIDNMCQTVIHKTRTVRWHGHNKWEIDEFHGDNEGLVVAELELSREDEKFDMPDWVGEEVTNDARYYNSNLAREPIK